MTKDPIEQLPQINGELIIDKEEIQVPLEDIIQEEEARNNMLEINNHHNCQQLQQPQGNRIYIVFYINKLIIIISY